jgi:hypothetical protein
MKNLAVVYFVFILGITISFSQTIPCSNFAITGSYPDSLNPNDYQITINFNAGQNDFVDYPHVSAVLDCNGDTVATGGLFYFGQFGQTTQDYPVTILETTNWCQPLTAVFIYGQGFLGEIDTCLLSFQLASITDLLEVQNTVIYPNPVTNMLTIVVAPALVGESFSMVDHLGKVVRKGKIENLKNEVLTQGIESGIYTVLIGSVLTQKIIVN